jgi:hypothetical protein
MHLLRQTARPLGALAPDVDDTRAHPTQGDRLTADQERILRSRIRPRQTVPFLALQCQTRMTLAFT